MSRRKALVALGTGSALIASRTMVRGDARNQTVPPEERVERCPNIAALQARGGLRKGDWMETSGFHLPGDGGSALYRIEEAGAGPAVNGADVIALQDGLIGVLAEGEAVNYRMFGAVGNGENDDGAQIKLAHQYAVRKGLPVVNPSGEFWIRETNDIPIQTNVFWGHTVFHIDERFNQKTIPRFSVRNDEPQKTIEWDEETKAAVLAKLKPGVQIIPELAPLAGCLVSVADAGDRIGLRAGARFAGQGWAREELFYVEEEGRIIGDIAWEFTNFTSVIAIPSPRNFLTIEGGGFLYSGDNPGESYTGYYHNGILIQRSRTIIRQQWMGLEPGRRDISMEPRRGHYVLSRVHDVTIEHVRAVPWEQNRPEESRVVRAGTYGIGGARWLNCTFRHLTAEAGWVAWGIFGTNINKNFRLENCHLNRVDVHFHCWNLHIKDCVIGFRGIAITGGGTLTVENSTRHGNYFINFRRDFGAKWDGHVRLRNCVLKPNTEAAAAVFHHPTADFDYRYPIGFARTIMVENLVVDYSAVPASTAPCWLMNLPAFGRTGDGTRLFFPHHVEFRNILVEGREQGVRLMRMADPRHYELQRSGSYDGSFLTANGTLLFERIQLERIPPGNRHEDGSHLSIGGREGAGQADARALFANIRFHGCENLRLSLENCFAHVHLEHCSIAMINAPGLRGGWSFQDCHLRAETVDAPGDLWTMEETLGIRFTNCTIHVPVVDGVRDSRFVNRLGFLRINGPVRHYHLNTALSHSLLSGLKAGGIDLNRDFIAALKARHALE